MYNKLYIISFLLTSTIVSLLEATTSVSQKIRDDPDLSQFYDLLERSQMANVTLAYKQVTIFAPINAAFQTYGKPINEPDAFVLYHMSNVAKRTDQLGSSYTSLNSELEGNPPLWVTHTSGIYHDDIYINNARLLVRQSDILGMKNNKEQVLHKIDEVLIPTRSPRTQMYNPTALEYLEHNENLITDSHRVRSFRQKVQELDKRSIFNTEGGHTFFIPVDEGFKNQRAALIDKKIIDGHVIPNQVLFTNPTRKDTPYQTLANDDNDVRVLITFTQETRGKNTVINYVKSHTILGGGMHPQGVVLVEILKANIPVKNGVIHLIHKPLMVVDNTVRELLKEKDGGILSSFVRAIDDVGEVGEQFYQALQNSHDVTLFAPCNAAWTDDLTLNNLIRDKQRFRDILNMHLVVDNRLYLDKVRQSNLKRGFQASTLNKRKNLYFNVVTHGHNSTMTVEGGGVNATVLQSDLAATNGIIHIIDRVLGVPYTTVLDKLKTDPMLNDTYILGLRRNFNVQLNDTKKKFTYFVPRDKAWNDARVHIPSAVKKIFMPEYGYHATNILERHLVIADIPYTMEKIKQMTNDSFHNSNLYPNYIHKREVELPTIRGKLSLYVEERLDHTFIIHWKGEEIPVFRPNVECTNGVIHVIDAPFLQDGDIRVSSSSIIKFVPLLLVISLINAIII